MLPINWYKRCIQGRLPVGVNGDVATVFFNLFSNYPNPLKDEKFLAYSPNPHYQSVELFKLQRQRMSFSTRRNLQCLKSCFLGIGLGLGFPG
jgi:hypothetical protein